MTGPPAGHLASMTSLFTVRRRDRRHRGFELLDGAGRVVGGLTGRGWRESGWVEAGGAAWELRRAGSRRFELAGPQGPVATAVQVSFWSSGWLLSTGDRTYELVKPSLWSSRYELRADGRPVGEVRRRGVLRLHTEGALPADLPPPVQVFAVAVVLTLWRRQQAAAGAAS